MPHYFVVAFGHGVGAPSAIPPAEAAEEMRRLIDKALNALQWSAADDLIVSVAPDGVMLALPDATPDRALRLAAAVQSQLQQAERKGRPIIPLSSAITFGPMRSVDVLGYSSNFEGRPAIAAARILAKLEPGVLAVDESAWGETLSRELSEPVRVKGKHPGETFSIKIHQKIRFPVPTGVALPPSKATAELRFRIAFASETKDQWRVEPAHAAERLVAVPWKEDTAFGTALNEFFGLTDRPVVEEKDRQALSAHATRLGDRLAKALLTEEDLRLIRRASPEGRPPLVTLESEDDLILSLPWELLRIEGSFAVRDARIDLIRTVPSPAGKPLALTPPDRYLRLLVLVSAPEGSRLNYEGESYRITRALHDHSEIVHTELGTLNDLAAGIGRHQPIGVHFSGHGSPGALAFENEEGGEEAVRITELLQKIREKTPERIPRFFYLASCHGNSPTRVEEGQAGSLSSAAQLHREGITQVVGHFGPIVDELSTRAEVGLYSALGEGRSTRHAVRQARLALAEPSIVSHASHRDMIQEQRGGAFPFA